MFVVYVCVDNGANGYEVGVIAGLEPDCVAGMDIFSFSQKRCCVYCRGLVEY